MNIYTEDFCEMLDACIKLSEKGVEFTADKDSSNGKWVVSLSEPAKRVMGRSIPIQAYCDAANRMREQRKIQAIKIIRDVIKCGLKDAKEIVEEISIMEKIPTPMGYKDPRVADSGGNDGE